MLLRTVAAAEVLQVRGQRRGARQTAAGQCGASSHAHTIAAMATGRSGERKHYSRQNVCTPRHSFPARCAVPDADRLPPHGVLAAKHTRVLQIGEGFPHSSAGVSVAVNECAQRGVAAVRYAARPQTLACCVISIFLTSLRRDAPYRTPYFPTIPTFLVRLPIFNIELCWVLCD